ncbi:hypothetical protein FGE05_01975 [Pseudomonas sp. ICMP22404]|nr:hypothetical protein FGE05_01975 [Pseudomonas sp. ICMP22404]
MSTWLPIGRCWSSEIVPTLCVGMPHRTLRVWLFRDAERPWLHSHAERGNDLRSARERSIRNRQVQALFHLFHHDIALGLPHMGQFEQNVAQQLAV